MSTPDRSRAGQNLATTATPAAPVAWPAGYSAAACLTFDLDAEAAVLTADISSVYRMSPMSHQAYGPLAGVPRILALLARHDISATFFVPGYSAHRYPAVVRAIAAAGHEIAHHSYFHENTIGMDARTEADMIDLGLEALWDVAGVRPAGYRAPMWELTYNTPRLLADRGFLDAGAHPEDCASGEVPHDVRDRRRRRPGAGKEVPALDANRLDVNSHAAVGTHRIGDVLVAEDVRRAVLVDHGGFHHGRQEICLGDASMASTLMPHDPVFASIRKPPAIVMFLRNISC